MNKRGDLPVTVLIIGVFGVCILAIFSFVYSSYKVNQSFIGVEIIEKANIQIETNNLEHLYLYKKVSKFDFDWSFDFFKEK